MSAIWFSLMICMVIAASQARTWRRWLAWTAVAVVFSVLFHHASPLARELLG